MNFKYGNSGLRAFPFQLDTSFLAVIQRKAVFSLHCHSLWVPLLDQLQFLPSVLVQLVAACLRGWSPVAPCTSLASPLYCNIGGNEIMCKVQNVKKYIYLAGLIIITFVVIIHKWCHSGCKWQTIRKRGTEGDRWSLFRNFSWNEIPKCKESHCARTRPWHGVAIAWESASFTVTGNKAILNILFCLFLHS